MAIRRDRTNQFGYVCPTENEAVWNADHPQRDMQIKSNICKMENIKINGIQLHYSGDSTVYTKKELS